MLKIETTGKVVLVTLDRPEAMNALCPGSSARACTPPSWR